MKRFRRRGRHFQSVMDEFEVGLMLSLCGQFIDLLSPEMSDLDLEADEDDAEGDPTAPEHPQAAAFDDLITVAPDPAGEDPDGDGEEQGFDPFALWEQELDPHRPDAQRPTDPVLLRLFPDAYRDDPAASEEFRRYTESDLRQRKIDEALVVLSSLEASERGLKPVRVEPEQVEPWLRTLTALRLVVAERLGITTDTPDGDPEAVLPDAHEFMHEVYDWLGFVQESLLRAL
ncbi:protein of unknown function [Raineyella antarctica]|uniref:Uncharacterized protein n=1 Tax=Raineyella antarctica TaxID=1577474 RepID=A0A1G6H4D0_9ACTN|nr:DUF2017 domain-containing protein [Raineyella antarctica]SDB88938.1 protein of unknown function [Raineyella antarctica]